MSEEQLRAELYDSFTWKPGGEGRRRFASSAAGPWDEPLRPFDA